MEGGIMDNKFAIYNFLTGIECKNKKPTYDEAYQRAFQLAWKDMATHTLKISDGFKEKYKKYFDGESKLKTENRKWLKVQMAAIIRKYCDELLKTKNEDDFKRCHEKICKHIIKDFPKCEIKYQTDKKDKEKIMVDSIEKIYTHIDDNIKTFTYGQAQKLVNMIVKYLYIYYRLYSGFYDEKIDFQTKYYHAPIDSIILEEIGQSNICWSKINDYGEYMDIKEKIDEKVKKEKYENSFIWELNVWNNRNK